MHIYLSVMAIKFPKIPCILLYFGLFFYWVQFGDSLRNWLSARPAPMVPIPLVALFSVATIAYLLFLFRTTLIIYRISYFHRFLYSVLVIHSVSSGYLTLPSQCISVSTDGTSRSLVMSEKGGKNNQFIKIQFNHKRVTFIKFKNPCQVLLFNATTVCCDHYSPSNG